MNLEVEKYVGELKELRSEVETMKLRIKNLESELEWRTKYGDYMSHQANVNASVHNYSYNRPKDKFKLGTWQILLCYVILDTLYYDSSGQN